MASVAATTRLYFQNACVAVLPDDAFIWFGSKLPTYSAPITLEIIGWRAQQVPAELSPEHRAEETFEIMCALTSFAGDQDFNEREAECDTQFKAIQIMVGNDPTLGGNVRWAYITTAEFTGTPNTDGQSIGTLDFTVECQQRIATLS